MQVYLHDMGEFDGSLPDLHGRFESGGYVPLYWSEPTRTPYLSLRSNIIIGVALVREVKPGVKSVAEFFILRACRGEGLGQVVAKALFELHRGEWRVAQLERNFPSQRFWRSVINDCTGGAFTEGWSENNPRGPEQIFNRGE